MTLSLEEKIIENAKQKALQITGEIGRELVVDRLCIGVGYTGMVLSDGHGGVSFTFREELGNSCGVMRTAGHIKGTPVSELTVLAGSQICDADRMMNIVAEGGGGMDIAAASDKLFERI